MRTGKNKELRRASLAVAGLALSAIGLAGSSARADTVHIDATGIGYGANSNYGLVSVGPNASVTINSGPNLGNVLVGKGSSANTSGGNNGSISGTINYDNTYTAAQIMSGGSGFGGLQNPPAAGQYVPVSTTVTDQAFADAQTLSNIATALTADHAFGTINTNTTFTFSSPSTGDTNHDGVDVINVADIHNVDLVFSGNANSVFVINVSDLYDTSGNTVTLLGGVQTGNVLFNFTGTGTVFQTSGGSGTSAGVYLSTTGAYQFSNLNLTGNLINTGGHIQLVSGSSFASVPPPTPGTLPAPLPSSAFAGLALLGVFGFLRKLRFTGQRRRI